MLSISARLAMALTAVAPAMGAAAIVAYFSYCSRLWALFFGVATVLSICASVFLIHYVQRKVQRTPIKCSKIDQADQQVLEFLLAYLLPVFSITSVGSEYGAIVLTIYSIAIIVLTVVQGDIFLFNPVLSLLGYHFYFVSSEDYVKKLLITRKRYHKPPEALTRRKVGEYMYLEATE